MPDFVIYLKISQALAGVAQLAGASPQNQKVACLTPGQVVDSPSSPGTFRGAHMGGKQSLFLSYIDISLSLFLSPSSHSRSNEKNVLR